MNAERLMKLARFLHNKLPEHKFLFSSILRGTDIPNETFSCGTVGCAIGWAPLVFPEDLKYYRSVFLENPTQVILAKTGERLDVSWGESTPTLREFFDITNDEAQVLFMPEGQSSDPDIPHLEASAKPKEVAANIALFVRRASPQFDTTL